MVRRCGGFDFRVYSIEARDARAPLSLLKTRLSSPRFEGRLAQLVRAPALQAGGRRFEPCTAHHFSSVFMLVLAMSRFWSLLLSLAVLPAVLPESRPEAFLVGAMGIAAV